MTLHVGPLPAGDERHLKACDQAACEIRRRLAPASYAAATYAADKAIAAYHRSLAEQGVRLVDASEVAEAMREAKAGQGLMGDEGAWREAADFLARFGGGDER